MALTRDELLSRIRRIASLRGGRVSFREFVAESGIPEKEVQIVLEGTWNEALAEIGLPTSSFVRPRIEDASILEAIARLIVRMKKWPSETALAGEHRRDGALPSLKTIRRLGGAADIAAKLVEHCSGRPELGVAAEVAASRISNNAPGPARAPALVNGYVYMMKSGRRYKIGHTNSPSRRHREVRLDLPDPTHLVHAIETDDPAGIEAYWHRRFQARRVRDTEFFNLDRDDVAAFKRRKSQ